MSHFHFGRIAEVGPDLVPMFINLFLKCCINSDTLTCTVTGRFTGGGMVTVIAVMVKKLGKVGDGDGGEVWRNTVWSVIIVFNEIEETLRRK